MCNYYTKLFLNDFSGTFSGTFPKNRKKNKILFGKQGRNSAYFDKNQKKIEKKDPVFKGVNRRNFKTILSLICRLSLDQFRLQNHLRI